MEDEKVTVQPNGHRTVGYATKFDQKAEELKAKTDKFSKGKDKDKKDDKKPAGGFDDTPIPRAPPGYTVKFTFHRADKLPMADINSMSSDPYIVATLYTDLPTRHKQDPAMAFRTTTIRRNCNPVWNDYWIVANVPASGFYLKARIYDEDPADHDDRLGNVHVKVDSLGESFQPIKEQAYKIKKRMGSKRAYLIRGCAAMFSKGVHMSGDVVLSIEVLGKTDTDNGGRMWTVGPCHWTKHLSPMVGRLAGTKEPGKDGKAERYSFQANQIQLAGPVPACLYHRYVEFRPFVKGMFTATSLRGRILHHALHHQHNRIYNYDRSTEYGSIPSPSQDLTLQFLDLVHYDKGGRIFTYVLTLDGQWRFTETGKEFGIDLLSKHTMHSDVNIYIAFSGEFFIRRSKNPHHEGGAMENEETHPPAELEGGPPKNEPPKDPAYYTLIIDNDSGTYRPNAKTLPDLKAFMQKNLPGLRIITLDCGADNEKMDKWKSEQRERKKKEGKGVVPAQAGQESISSSDEEDSNEQQRAVQGVGKPRVKDRFKEKTKEPVMLVKAARGYGKNEGEGINAGEGVVNGSAEKKEGDAARRLENGEMAKIEEPFKAAAKPAEKVEEWRKGDKEREERETEDDMGSGG